MTIIFLGVITFIAYKAYDTWRLNEAEKQLTNPPKDYNIDFTPPTYYLRAVQRMYDIFPEDWPKEGEEDING